MGAEPLDKDTGPNVFVTIRYINGNRGFNATEYGLEISDTDLVQQLNERLKSYIDSAYEFALYKGKIRYLETEFKGFNNNTKRMSEFGFGAGGGRLSRSQRRKRRRATKAKRGGARKNSRPRLTRKNNKKSRSRSRSKSSKKRRVNARK